MTSSPQRNSLAADPNHRDSLSNVDSRMLMSNSRQYKCICEMCSCGRHRCPHPHIKGQFESSYQSQFKEIHQKVAATPPPCYQYQERHYNPQALKTRYKQTFVAPIVEQNQEATRSRLENIGKSIVRPHVPHVPFVGSSSYSEQFKPFELKHPINPEDPYLDRRQKIPDYNFQSPAKFQDTTSYKTSFASPGPIKLQKSPYPEYIKPQVPFYGTSSYQQSYPEYKLQPKYESYYNMAVSNAPRVKFQGQSSYKDQFKGYKVENRYDSGGKGCVLDHMNLPETNFLNSSPHIYYDETEHKFI